MSSFRFRVRGREVGVGFNSFYGVCFLVKVKACRCGIFTGYIESWLRFRVRFQTTNVSGLGTVTVMQNIPYDRFCAQFTLQKHPKNPCNHKAFKFEPNTVTKNPARTLFQCSLSHNVPGGKHHNAARVVMACDKDPVCQNMLCSLHQETLL